MREREAGAVGASTVIEAEPRPLSLTQLQVHGHRLSYSFEVAGHEFTTSVWYEGVDLDALSEQIGRDSFEELALHIALFDMNKGLSVKPTSVEVPAGLDRHVTPGLARLWNVVATKVWAQWRFENKLSDYEAPPLRYVEPPASPGIPSQRTELPFKPLVLCGGGKDSLAVLSLLDALGCEYGTLGYSSSIYGPSGRQHELIGALARTASGSVAHHEVSVFEDFLDSPVLSLGGALGVGSLTAAETPFSVFLALPVMYAHGYSHLIVGHERSADDPNLVWNGEEVNHQWGKSREAEILLDTYVQDLSRGARSYFSLLGTLSDPLIFQAVARAGGAFALTHSCNVEKPWCLRCPKCAYVWMSAHAYLTPEVVAAAFGSENLFDVPELDRTFEQLLGLTGHKPFECIGTVDEARLALFLCLRRGIGGSFLDRWGAVVAAELDVDAARTFLTSDPSRDRVPDALRAPFARLVGELEADAAAAVGGALDGARLDDERGETTGLESVAFVAPFRLGVDLDLTRLVHDTARAWAADWVGGDWVEGIGKFEWEVFGQPARSTSLQFDVDDYEGTTGVPRRLAQLTLTRSGAAAHSPAEQWVWRAVSAALTSGFVLDGITVTISPFGFGSIAVVAGCPQVSSATVESLKALVERASSALAQPLSAVVAHLAEDVRSHVGAAWLTDREPPAGAGQLLWVHRVVRLCGQDGEVGDVRARKLTLQANAVPSTSAESDGESRVLAGIGTSVVVCSPRGRAFDDLVSSVGLANVVWAAVQDQSDAVLQATVTVSAERREARLAQVRAMTEEVAGADHRASTFRAVLHDQINAMSPQQIDCWSWVDAAWRLGPHLEELDRRRADLKNAHRDTVDHLQSLYSDRLNKVVTGLTLLGGLSVIIALIDYAFGGPLSSVQASRIVILAACTAVLFGAVAATWVSVGRPRRRTGRWWRRGA